MYILLEETDWQTEQEIYDLCFEIGLENDVVLSPVVFSRGELQNRALKESPFLKNLARDGVPT